MPAGAVAEVTTRDVATAEQVTGAALGRFAALFVLLFLASGGSVVAADAIAGEKERGTLETLLTTAIDRRELSAHLRAALAVDPPDVRHARDEAIIREARRRLGRPETS